MAARIASQPNNGKLSDDEELFAGFTASNQQERRDSELAFRLAQESNLTVDSHESASLPLKRSNYAAASKAGKKHDLSGWKYSELRDTINTSCDVELLEACRYVACLCVRLGCRVMAIHGLNTILIPKYLC